MRGATHEGRVCMTERIFQSTLPYAGSDAKQRRPTRKQSNFNPRSPMRGATDGIIYACLICGISIHAPLCGERRSLERHAESDQKISIHAPLCGERPLHGYHGLFIEIFQSTLPYAGSDRNAERSF